MQDDWIMRNVDVEPRGVVTLRVSHTHVTFLFLSSSLNILVYLAPLTVAIAIHRMYRYIHRDTTQERRSAHGAAWLEGIHARRR